MKDSTRTNLEAEMRRSRRNYPENNAMLAGLMEEVGELARAFLEQQGGGGALSGDVYTEALHVAAVALRIAEEGDAQFPLYEFTDRMATGFFIEDPDWLRKP